MDVELLWPRRVAMTKNTCINPRDNRPFENHYLSVLPADAHMRIDNEPPTRAPPNADTPLPNRANPRTEMPGTDKQTHFNYTRPQELYPFVQTVLLLHPSTTFLPTL